ncbi:MAG: hypothetical protein JXJ04_01290 [Spirochaetales bacterium]|nr:hypothetical protein [Spirochaetales bacterium]
MNLTTITGKVTGKNTIKSDGKEITCYKNGMEEAVSPIPLDLSGYLGKEVAISGMLHGALYRASLLSPRDIISRIIELYGDETLPTLLNDLVAIGTWPEPEKPGVTKGSVKESGGSVAIDTVPLPDRPQELRELLTVLIEMTGNMKIRQLL